jgi:ureidoacrylate peracid hydrolase
MTGLFMSYTMSEIGGLPEWIDPSRVALCVIDMQVDFASPNGVLGGYGVDMSAVPAAIAQTEKLIAAARIANVPVIFVGLETSPETDSPVWAERMRRREGDPDAESNVCRKGTKGVEFYGPQPQAGDPVVMKPKYSAFYATGFEALLKTLGVDTLVMCGLTTECCIDCTVRDAFHRDYHIIIADDACAAYGADIHEAALRMLELNCAIIRPTEKIAAVWEGRV